MTGVVLRQTGNVVEEVGVIEKCRCQQKQAGKNRYRIKNQGLSIVCVGVGACGDVLKTLSSTRIL